MQIFIFLGAAVLLTAFSGGGNPLDRAIAAADEGRLETAVHHYSVALSRTTLGSSDKATAYNNRGVIFARLGQYHAALSDFTTSKSMAAGDSILFKNLDTAKKMIYAKQHDLTPPSAKFLSKEQSSGFWLF